jgi:hypothetical protein
MSGAPELDRERETPLHREHGTWVYRGVPAEAGVDAGSVLDEVREQRNRDLNPAENHAFVEENS